MRREKSAGAVVYCKNDKIEFLLLKNTLKKTYWEFPKGKIEKKEGIDETVEREVREETNLEIFQIIQGFKHILKWFFKFNSELIKKEAVYLLIEVDKKEKNKVKINHEHQDFEWMDYDTALKKTNIKGNKELIKKAYKFIKMRDKQKRLF